MQLNCLQLGVTFGDVSGEVVMGSVKEAPMGSVKEITINKGQPLMEQRDHSSYRLSQHQLHKQPGKEIIFSTYSVQSTLFSPISREGGKQTGTSHLTGSPSLTLPKSRFLLEL